jgi:Ca-activated chloride channel family protein
MNPNTLNIKLNQDKQLISKEAATQRILEIRLQAPGSSQENGRPRLNLALVLDRSGSMNGEKLEYVKQAAIHVLDLLQKQDQVALVVFDDVVQVLSPSLSVTNGNRFELKQLISRIQSGGSTDLCAGWLTGCKAIAASAQEGTINRTMLLTDGEANVGVTDLEILAAHAFELYKDTISTSTFGVGLGFNEHLLEAMANKGGGNFEYIENPNKIPQIFVKEFDQLVGIAVRKVELKFELPPSIEWQVLGGWSTEYKNGCLHIYIGAMLADKTQDIYVKLQIPAECNTSEVALTAKVFGQGETGQVYEDQARVEFQYAGSAEVVQAHENKELMERFSLVELAETAAEALKLERAGQRDNANRMLNQSLNRNRPYISLQDDAIYQGMSTRMKQGMTEADRKRAFADSYNRRRNKVKDEK